ncbi:hypothetical protein ACFYOK_36015 [Microbispora bryophytorum]|uniref:hypothetical protein n=1 Tax=Microbispora bryophytorum TaxID=1460882 RepID=UPI0033F919C6
MDIKTRKQLQTRAARLHDLEEEIDRATEALKALKPADRHPAEVRVRVGFVYRDDPSPVEPSDRRAPDPAYRPPATRIMTPTGSALRLYLLALYEAQLHAKPGQRPSNPLPLVDDSGRGRGWVDLLAPRSSLAWNVSINVATSRADRKKRRIISALKALSNSELPLVHLPNHGKAVDTYEHFQLMNEAGPQGHADPVPYVVPRREDYFVLPPSLFLNGWIHVLEDSELTFLMMLIHWQWKTRTHPVKIPSDDRVLRYGIGRDAYEAHRLLARYGLVDLEPDPDRRSDGTVVNHKDAGWNPLHKFRILTAGLHQPAVTTALEGLKQELRAGRIKSA